MVVGWRNIAMKFNKQQQLAIDTIDENVCLVAGAGTGKTAVLTQRFINIIKNSKFSPLEAMESILAITFTEKATEEMLSRIGKTINEMGSVEDSLAELENYVPFANVSTIDSFCMGIIQENSLKIGLNPNFEIMPEYLAKSMLKEITEDTLGERLESGSILSEIMIDLKKNRIKNISGLFINAYKFIVNKGYDFDSLLSQTIKFYNNSSDHVISDIEFIEEIIQLFYTFKANKIFDNRNKNAVAFLSKLESMDFQNEDFSRNSRIELCIELNEILTKLTRASYEDYKDILEKSNSIIMVYEYENVVFYKEIISILKEIDTRFRKHKLTEGKLEFSDLIYYATKILEDKGILRTYQNKFQYVMVDEYQDTNYNQKNLIYKLCSINNKLDRRNLFVVGDPKQSIYGFRGSDLRVFNETVEDIRSLGGELILLSENYRSSEELVGFANSLFSELMGENYSPLVASTALEKIPVELIGNDEQQSDEAERIARRVQTLISEGYKYGAIAILFRSSTKLKILEDTFNRYNIPYINPKSKEFFNKREILDIILFLKFVDTPEDNESLYGLLRSYFFLLDDDSIYKILKSKDAYLYENLFIYDGEDKKINRAKEILQRALSIANEVNVYELLSSFISDTGYYELLSAITNTPQAIENVRKFEDLVLDYVSIYSGFINQFLDYYYDISSEDTNEAMVDLGDEAVKFMTIHASKGLEFPVVILYDGGSVGKSSGSRGGIRISPDLGIGVVLKNMTLLSDKIKEQLNIEDEEESNRVLYVAFTRAKERFILVEPTNISKGSFYKKLTSSDYAFDKKLELQSINRLNIETKKIVTDESLISERSVKFTNSISKSSISAYSVYKRCPREYFYSYKLKLGDIDHLKAEDSKFEELELENVEGPKGAILGTIVHELISDYNMEENIDSKIRDALSTHGYENDEAHISLVKKFIDNYISNYYRGKKLQEYAFMQKLDNGYLVGSVDEIRFKADGSIEIIDFKTNKVNNLKKLTESYKPQMLLYSKVVHDLYGEYPKPAVLHFLETNEIVNIEIKDDEIEQLTIDLNSFLSFTSNNDNIDEYQCVDTCNEYCKYLEFCDRKNKDE